MKTRDENKRYRGKLLATEPLTHQDPQRQSSRTEPGISRALILCGLVSESDTEPRVRFLALPDFLTSSGTGTGSTQPREYN
jgi:hypothetical protein